MSDSSADENFLKNVLPIPEVPGPGRAFSFRLGFLAIVKVFIYIVLCFATMFGIFQPLIIFVYQLVHDKALFCFLLSSFDLILALAMLFVFSLVDKKTFLSYGFGGCTFSGGVKETAAGLLLGGAMVSTVMLVLYLSGCYKVLSASLNIQLLTFLPFFIVAAMREEVMIRGYVFQTLEKAWGTIGAIVISSMMFGFLHLINFESGVPLGEKLYSCTCLTIDAGLIFAVAYLVKRRLWFPFGLHLSWNLFEGPIYGTLVSGLTLSKPFLNATVSGPFFLTGGIFGPEASLVEVAICLVLVAMLWRKIQWQSKSINKAL